MFSAQNRTLRRAYWIAITLSGFDPKWGIL